LARTLDVSVDVLRKAVLLYRVRPELVDALSGDEAAPLGVHLRKLACGWTLLTRRQ
jgi:hypothetical protein